MIPQEQLDTAAAELLAATLADERVIFNDVTLPGVPRPAVIMRFRPSDHGLYDGRSLCACKVILPEECPVRFGDHMASFDDRHRVAGFTAWGSTRAEALALALRSAYDMLAPLIASLEWADLKTTLDLAELRRP
jgi:hypothetical protein